VSVTVYVTSWCPHCRRAQRWLRRHKIRYQAIDVGRSAAGQRALRAVNPRGGVPTFVIGRRVIRGWSPLAVRYAIQAEKARLGGS